MVFKIRHIFSQYMYLYRDSRLDRRCKEVLAKSDEYIQENYKKELYRMFATFKNPLMEHIHQDVVKGDFTHIFFAGYLATLDEETAQQLAAS